MTRHPAIPLFGALVVLCGLCWPAGLPATAAEPAAARAAAASGAGNVAARVGVRSGEHPTFTRLVFDWTVPVQYTVESADGQVRVQFDRSAELAIDRIVARPPEGLSGFGQSRDGDGRTTFGFTADGRIRHFRDGTKVVVDVMKAPEKAAGAPAGPVASAVFPAAAAPAAAAPAGVPADGPPATRPPVSLIPPGQSGTTVDAQKAAVPQHQGKALGSPLAQAAPTPLQAPSVRSAPGVPRPAAQPRLPVQVSGVTLPVEVTNDQEGMRLRFPFDAPVAAAAFRRGKHLWLVFGAPVRIDVDGLAAAGSPIETVEQIGHPDATVLRFVTEPGYNPSMASNGTAWNFILAPQTLKPETPLDVALPASPDGSVSVTKVTPGGPLGLNDPEVGDVFVVVPVMEAAYGVAKPQDFADFRLLLTAQGVVVTVFNDSVGIRPRVDGVSITATGGLNITSPADRKRLLEVASDEDAAESFFDFAGWQHPEEGDYDNARKALVERLVGASEADRNRARLDLAHFYFAHGLADRANGVLTRMIQTAPEFERSPSFQALRGATALLMGDLEAAQTNLDDRGLDPEPEIDLWRAAVLAEKGDIKGAAPGLKRSGKYVAGYPENLRARFGLAGAQAGLATDDMEMAEFWLSFLQSTPLTYSQTERSRLIEAQIAALKDETDKALEIYTSLVEGQDRYSRARASLERANLMMAQDRITAGEAADQLDRLRYVWRGDELEFSVLRRLGQLQIAARDYREGLLTLKRTISNFADEPYAANVAEEMRASFRRLYLEGEADDLPAITAIGLFNEFRELAPAGDDGDEIIRRLADRMIAVDLLDKAAELLAHQVEFRLEGEQKARVGTRLAVVHLLNRQPAEALAALDNSRITDLPADLARERQLVGARAWAETGDTARALALIAEDRSRDADQLRAEIYWRARDWKGAAAMLGRLVGPAPAEGVPFSEKDARTVMNNAVALALTGDSGEKLSQLRSAFGTAMEGTPFAADFRVIAAADRSSRDFDSVLQRAASVEDFDAFLKSYRARLLEPQKVSAARSNGASG
jgi:hypothetical protein